MTKSALINGKILCVDGIVSGRAVIIDGREISGISSNIPAGATRIDLGGQLLAPGYIDIQINGGGGRLFNSAPTIETIKIIGAAHRKFGTSCFLPTIISDDLSVVKTAIAAVETAISQGVPGVLGIHLEGPFLNPAKKGIHDETKFLRLTDEHLALLTSLRGGKTLITLAPELAAPNTIAKLTAAGATVSAGHTNASYEQIQTGIKSGVTGFTHLFNAMSPFTSRAPGAVGAALNDQDTWCGIIADGQHVAPASLKLAMRCKPLSKFILVTDAMPTVGSDGDSFVLQGQTITAIGDACQAQDGTLAGSNLTMERAVKNCIDLLGVRPEDALNMASKNAADFLGISRTHGQIKIGQRANFTVLDDQFNVTQTWINGRPN